MAFFRKLQIKYQMIVIAVLTVGIMSFIIYITYFQTSNIIINKNKKYTSDIILQANENINSNCLQIDKTITSIAYDETVQKYLIETDTAEKIKLSKTLDKFFENITYLRDGIFDIVIIGDNGNFYSKAGNTFVILDYKPFLASKKKPNYTGIVTLKSKNIFDKKSIIVGMPVYSTIPEHFGQNSIGIVAFIVDPHIFESSFEKLEESSVKLYFLDRNNNIITSNTQDEQGKGFDLLSLEEIKADVPKTVMLNGKRSIIQTQSINSIEGTIVSITHEQNLLKEIIDMRMTVVIIFIISLLLITIPFYITVNNILQPIKIFMRFMRSIKAGNLKTLKSRLNLEGYSEMTILAHEFNQMLDEINGLTHRLVDTSSMLYRAELEKKQAELGFLQSQINPHFLYNTMESIKTMAKIKGADEIYEMAKAMGRIFRYGVKGADEVRLSEELDIVKDYIMIQRVRFKDRFEVFYGIPPSVMECIIPKMLLQPVVENAVFHGIEPSMDKCTLSISGEVDEGNTLVICIEDDGVGMENETLSEIRSRLSEANDENLLKTSAGIGVINVNNRIRLKWGNKYGIRIDSIPGKGTTVVLRIPARRQENV